MKRTLILLVVVCVLLMAGDANARGAFNFGVSAKYKSGDIEVSAHIANVLSHLSIYPLGTYHNDHFYEHGYIEEVLVCKRQKIDNHGNIHCVEWTIEYVQTPRHRSNGGDCSVACGNRHVLDLPQVSLPPVLPRYINRGSGVCRGNDYIRRGRRSTAFNFGRRRHY